MSLDGITNNVTVLGATRLEWTDTKINDGFKREILFILWMEKKKATIFY
jgi:hypothetical protein